MSRIEPTLLHKINQRRVIELLQQRGPASRADVVRHSGISAPTVSKAVAALLDQGLLEEGESPEGSLGRPGKVLRLASETAQVIGVELDARRCWVVSASLDGKLHDDGMHEFATPGTYHGLIEAIVERAALLKKRNSAKTLGVGVSMPGLVNRRLQEGVFSPNLHVTDGRSPARDLAKRLKMECVILQESHALCLAERNYGDIRGLDNFAMLDVTTGLGLGVMSGGRLLEGNSGLGGEIGHITIDPHGRLCGCGNHGCLETLATDTALARAISERYGMTVDIDDVIRLVRDGELQPADEIRQTLEYLAIAVAAVINIFNPSTIFLHGRMLDAQDNLFSQLLHLVRQRALAPSLADCRIVRARGSKRQGAVAAIINHLTSALAPTLA